MRQIANICAGISSFFIIFFIYIQIAGPIPFSVNSVVTQKTDTFAVSGEGIVSVIPDMATVTVGVSSKGATVKVVQEQINSAINKISSAISEIGIDKGDIKTTNYNINPEYDYTQVQQRITGYTANTNLTIKIKDVTKINDVIDSATKNGANQVGGISFDIDNKTLIQDQARKLAVEQAKEKAINASKIAGFRLGKIVNYSENFNNGTRLIPMELMAYDKTETTSTQIETGSNEIRVIVTLSYEIH